MVKTIQGFVCEVFASLILVIYKHLKRYRDFCKGRFHDFFGFHCPCSRGKPGWLESQSGGLLVKTFQPLAAKVHIHNLLTGLGSFGMGIGLGANLPRHSQRCGLAQALGHQGKSATGDQRKANQIDNSQEVVQGQTNAAIILV
jgi:hypothetical protein